MGRPGIGSAVGAVALAIVALAVVPAAAGSRHVMPAAATAHHKPKLTVTVVPRHPRVGDKVRIYVTGAVKGARYYSINSGCIDKQCWNGVADCAYPISKSPEYVEPLNRFVAHRFKAVGVHRVSLGMAAFCTRPALHDLTVKPVTITVRAS